MAAGSKITQQCQQQELWPSKSNRSGVALGPDFLNNKKRCHTQSMLKLTQMSGKKKNNSQGNNKGTLSSFDMIKYS